MGALIERWYCDSCGGCDTKPNEMHGRDLAKVAHWNEDHCYTSSPDPDILLGTPKVSYWCCGWCEKFGIDLDEMGHEEWECAVCSRRYTVEEKAEACCV